MTRSSYTYTHIKRIIQSYILDVTDERKRFTRTENRKKQKTTDLDINRKLTETFDYNNNNNSTKKQ